MVTPEMPTIIRIITVYDRRDPEDGGPSGDYSGVEVVFDVEMVAKYGDEYHDKGLDKARAFIAGTLIGGPLVNKYAFTERTPCY